MEPHRQKEHPTLFHECVCKKLFETKEKLQNHLKEHETIVCATCASVIDVYKIQGHICKNIPGDGSDSTQAKTTAANRTSKYELYTPLSPPASAATNPSSSYNASDLNPTFTPVAPPTLPKPIPKIYTYSYGQESDQAVPPVGEPASGAQNAASDVTGSAYYSRSFACTFPGCYKRFTRDYDLERHVQAENHY